VNSGCLCGCVYPEGPARRFQGPFLEALASDRSATSYRAGGNRFGVASPLPADWPSHEALISDRLASERLGNAATRRLGGVGFPREGRGLSCLGESRGVSFGWPRGLGVPTEEGPPVFSRRRSLPPRKRQDIWRGLGARNWHTPDVICKKCGAFGVAVFAHRALAAWEWGGFAGGRRAFFVGASRGFGVWAVCSGSLLGGGMRSFFSRLRGVFGGSGGGLRAGAGFGGRVAVVRRGQGRRCLMRGRRLGRRSQPFLKGVGAGARHLPGWIF
jgi:hypothetical protein